MIGTTSLVPLMNYKELKMSALITCQILMTGNSQIKFVKGVKELWVICHYLGK